MTWYDDDDLDYQRVWERTRRPQPLHELTDQLIEDLLDWADDGRKAEP